MKPDPHFVEQPKHFWANVRSISQHLGYTNRKTKQIKVHDLSAMVTALGALGLGTAHVIYANGNATAMGKLLVDYFSYRADVLNNFAEPRLMDAAKAAATYAMVREATGSKLPVVMNKQKGDKKKPAYLTNMVNWLIDANAEGIDFDFCPGELTTFTQGDMPLRTLARRVDGAFPSTVNPIAIWEYKEYYHTTTFGSRVADGVYETLLDGMELEELFNPTASNASTSCSSMPIIRGGSKGDRSCAGLWTCSTWGTWMRASSAPRYLSECPRLPRNCWAS